MKNTPKVGLPLSNFWGAVHREGFFIQIAAVTCLAQAAGGALSINDCRTDSLS